MKTRETVFETVTFLPLQNVSFAKPFGACEHDIWLFWSLISANALMAAGNLLLLVLVHKCFQKSRMDLVVIHQAIVDTVYTFVFPGGIVDARRQISNRTIFVIFKVVEDSLLTLSVFAVLLVNLHKYLFIRHSQFYYQKFSLRQIIAAISFCWVVIPVAFGIRNTQFHCELNDPCAPSYFKCLAGKNATGEIPSILFYLIAALAIILLNANLVYVAVRFRSQQTFLRDSKCTTSVRKSFSRRQSAGTKTNSPGVGTNGAGVRRNQIKFLVYPLMTSALLLITVSPFWIALTFCHLDIVCVDQNHSLFYLMRLHSLFNPYCTILTHRKFRSQCLVWMRLADDGPGSNQDYSIQGGTNIPICSRPAKSLDYVPNNVVRSLKADSLAGDPLIQRRYSVPAGVQLKINNAENCQL